MRRSPERAWSKSVPNRDARMSGSVLRRMAAFMLLLTIVLAIPVGSWAGLSAKPATALSNHLLVPLNDIEFRPDENGFSFENYGSDSKAKDLGAADVRKLFGDAACSIINGDEIVLTPPAAQWMEEINGMMAGGHCEGMAVLSLLFYTGKENVSKYGGDSAYELSFDDAGLQREIAYWWATQAVDPTQANVVTGTPVDILNVLQSHMSKEGETFTVGIYMRDGSGGHAVTPFAVEDDGGGKHRILVYDNNYPGDTRAIEVNSNTNTWSYEASINPEVESVLYEGDAETMTLDLTPTSARLEQQSAPFAARDDGNLMASAAGLTEAPLRYNQLFLEGNGHLLITNDEGQRLGYAEGTFVNEIPGARYVRVKVQRSGDSGPEPIYWLPEDMNLDVTIDGTNLDSKSPTDLMMIGPGFAIGVEDIMLEPGQKDTVIFMPTDQAVSYETDRTESPNFVVAIDQGDDADYYFEIQGTEMEGGGAITALLDTKEKDLLINTEKLTNEGVFNLVMTRITDEEEDEISGEGIALKAGAIIYMHYGDWKGSGSNVEFGVDLDGDGNIDDIYEVGAFAPEKEDGGGVPYYVWIIIAAAVVLAAAISWAMVIRRRSKETNGGSDKGTPLE